MASLMIIQGANEYSTYELCKKNSVGSDRFATVSVPDPTLAASQFEVLYRGNRFLLNSIDGKSSVFVNGEEVDHRFLENGDVIQAGNVQFLFCQEDDREPPDAPDPIPDVTNFDPESSSFPGLGSVDKQRIEGRADIHDTNLALKHLASAEDSERRLSILFEVAAAISEVMSTDVLLPKLLDLVFQVFPANMGSIWLMDQGKCRVKAARDRRGKILGKVHISTTILREAIKTKSAILTRDAMEDDRFLSGQSIVDLDIHSAMCVPLIVKDEVLGVIQIENSDPDSVFSQNDLDLLSAIAVQAAVSIKNAQLFANVREKERFELEIGIASRIQQSLLPHDPPAIEGLRFAGRLKAAREGGGDYYDFLPDGRGGLYVAVGDVTGKGLPAGLVMVMARSLLLPLVEDGLPTRDIVVRANRHMFANTDKKTFMSLLLLHWDPVAKVLVYTGAGHEHLILLPTTEEKPRVFRAGGMALGLSDKHESAFVEKQIPFEVGDVLVLYTDGVTEAEDKDRNQFTLERMVRTVHRYRNLDPEALLQATIDRLAEHVGAAEQSDDITLVVAKRSK